MTTTPPPSRVRTALISGGALAGGFALLPSPDDSPGTGTGTSH